MRTKWVGMKRGARGGNAPPRHSAQCPMCAQMCDAQGLGAHQSRAHLMIGAHHPLRRYCRICNISHAAGHERTEMHVRAAASLRYAANRANDLKRDALQRARVRARDQGGAQDAQEGGLGGGGLGELPPLHVVVPVLSSRLPDKLERRSEYPIKPLARLEGYERNMQVLRFSMMDPAAAGDVSKDDQLTQYLMRCLFIP